MKLRILAVMALAFLTTTCMQSPIFSIIATETAPKKPRIEGAPTNMVLFEWGGAELMFVASGRLHWYAQAEVDVETPADDPEDPPTITPKMISRWDDPNDCDIPQPREEGEKITSLAVTKSRLYALCIDNQSTNMTLRYIESDGNKWTEITPYSGYQIQTIYADPEEERLFVGAKKGTNFIILYLANNTLTILKDETTLATNAPKIGMLSGAIHKGAYFYLSTTTNMIYQVNDNDITIKHELTDKTNDIKTEGFLSMIKLKDTPAYTIIAVARKGGVLYEVKDGNDLSPMQHTGEQSGNIETGRYATGALALWEDSDRNMYKLIAGIQGGLYNPTNTTTSSSSYTHGYVEFDLNLNGSFNTSSPRRDSNRLETVDNSDRYTTSLGKHPINHLFQTPVNIDENRTFFASTQTAGLWSYRDRPDNGGWQWNAEE